MKRILFVIVFILACAYQVCAQNAINTTNVSTVKVRGRTSVPPLSTTGNAVFYFDKTSGHLKYSENGGAYANFGGGGSSSLTKDTTTISGGSDGNVLKNNAGVVGEYAISGTGSVAMTNSPALVTPTLGVAAATSINKVTITAPATGATLTIPDGVTLNAGAGGTLASAAFVATGTSGATVPLLNGANTFSALQSFSGGLLLNQTSSGMANIIYLGSGSTGAVNNTLGIIAAGNGSDFDATAGAYFGMRGNTYSAVATQRGNLFFAAGSPSAPATNEGEIRFITKTDTAVWKMTKDGHFINGDDNLYNVGADGANRPANVYAGTLVKSPTISATSSLVIGSGTSITKYLSATATLDFANLAAIGCEDLTISVVGAALGDTVAIGVPNGSVVANGTFTGWVSATDTVSIRFCTVVSGDPASGTFRASVIKH